MSRVGLALSICVLLLAGPAAAQDAVRDVRRAFRTTDDPSGAFAARDAALTALGVPGDAGGVDAVLDAWLQVHAEARAIERARGRPARQAMPSITEMRSRADLNRCLALTTRLEDALAAAVGEARRRATDAAFDTRLPLALRAALAARAAKPGAPTVTAARAALLEARRPDAAWTALRVLEAAGPSAADVAHDVAPLLADGEPAVRTQAARTLAACGCRVATEALIERLAVEDGRVQRAVGDALEQLTGQGLGTAAASWQAWFAAEGEAFVAGRVARSTRRAAAPRAAPSATRGAFFGIPQDGEAVLYLVDFSKSMRNRMRGGGDTTRWETCIRELKQAIRQLGEDRTFNIVVFAQRVVAWSERQMPADARNIAAAEKWIDYLDLELGTSIFEAFEVAFDLGGASVVDGYVQPAIDTICFLSDGLPTIRNPDTPRKLSGDDSALVLALLRRRDPLGLVVVNTVMIGRDGGGPLMRAIARQHGGSFVAR